MTSEQENFMEQEISEFFSYALSKTPPKAKKPLAQATEIRNRLTMQKNPKSQEKLDQIRIEMKKKEMDECTFKPKLNHNIKVEPRYCKAPIKKPVVQKENIEETIEWTFKPKICEHSNRLKRGNKIDEILYKDALRRKHQRHIEILTKPEVSLSHLRTGKIAGQKFVKEYAKVLSSIQREKSNYLDISKMHTVLCQMGFVNTQRVLISHPENHLIYEAYDILCSEEEGGVRVRNLAIFLLAVLGIFNVEGASKSSHSKSVQGPVSKDNVCSKFGNMLDSSGNFAINRNIGLKLQNYFKLFYVNRLSKPKSKSPVRRSPTPNHNKSLSSTTKVNLKTLSPNNVARLQTQPTHLESQNSNFYRWMTGGDDQISSHNLSIECQLQKSKIQFQQPRAFTQYNQTNFEESVDSFPLTEYVTKPKTHMKTKSQVVLSKRPIFIMEVRVRSGVIELPVYDDARSCPRSVIEYFAKEYELDSESRERLYQTLCESLIKYGQ